jgi:acyl carrier protein
MVQRLVGCGPAVPGHRILIIDPETSRECGESEVGEILIQGPSVTGGYWNRDEETEAEFGATVEGYEGRFLRTGDLGFFRDGQLYVTGRVKDVIIIRGRNHYPQDIEQSAEEAHPAVLAGAAFALDDAAGERLVVVHQLDRQYRGSDYQQIIQSIRRSIVEQHELDPYAIVLIRQTSLPITSSGKVQRNLCREQYLADELRVVHCWTNPAFGREQRSPVNGRVQVQIHGEGVAVQRDAAAAGDAKSTNIGGAPTNGIHFGVRPLRPGAPVIELDRAAERIEAWMLEWLVGRLGLDAADVARDRPFAELGVDSLTAVELSHELEQQFGVPLPPIVAWNYPTPAALSRYLAEQTTGIKDPNSAAASESVDDLPTPAATEAELAALLAEVENLSDEEAKRLLGDDEQRAN